MVSSGEEEGMVDFEALRDNARVMLRQENVQEKLATLFASYLSDVQPIIIAATVQRSGVRPEGLENEIYSCFHHVARGLCYKKNRGDAGREVKKGEETHLKRLLLDAYKIAIRPYLEEYQFIVQGLCELASNKDFNSTCFGPEPYEKIRQVLKIKTEIKQAYKDAKHQEALGNSDRAFVEFDRALNGCYELERAVNAVMEEDVYIVARAYIARRDADRRADKRENRIYNLISLIISGIAAVCALLAWLYPRDGKADAPLPARERIEALHR